MPKVSIILPNYNHEQYLKKRIDSILNQTYSDFELIILDDCSTDNSKEVIESYRSNSKVSCIIYNEKNGGNTFTQWNKGIELTKGDYVWIAESDDWCEITLLETLVEGLNKNPNCSIAYCQSYCVIDDNRIKFQSNHTSLCDVVKGKEFISNFIIPRNPIFNAGMAVWRKSLYASIEKKYMHYKLAGDFCFWIELCTIGDVFISGRLLNYFRQHDKNVSFTTTKNGLGIIEQIVILKDLLKENLINPSNYNNALKRLYTIFKFSEKGISNENTIALNKLFTEHISKRSLHSYHLKKTLQLKLKQLLHL